MNLYFINKKYHWHYPLYAIMWHWPFKNNFQIFQGCCIVIWSFHTELSEIAIVTLNISREYSKEPQTTLYLVWWVSYDGEYKWISDHLALKDKLSVKKKKKKKTVSVDRAFDNIEVKRFHVLSILNEQFGTINPKYLSFRLAFSMVPSQI